MKCPKCNNADTKVVDSRIVENGNSIRRRRECEYCQNRFTTFERKGVTELIVIKKNGTKEMYDRQKLKRAIMLAFAKREVSPEKIEEIVTNMEVNWSGTSSEIKTSQIGEDILNMLKEVDPVAYVRFASVYMKFDSLGDFKDIIN